MISEATFLTLLYIWMGIAVFTFPVLLKVTAPYGRHTTSSWGPTMNNKWAWFLMEVPVIIVFSWLLFSGPNKITLPVYIFYGVFMFHYINRVFIFPLRIKSKGKRMPIAVVAMAFFFNICNGFFNGYWFGYLSPEYTANWLKDPRFITGVILFITGMLINLASDHKLLNLRKGGKKGYYIPKGGLFNYVSSPNLFGEMIEWLGWAIMSWCLPSFSFALWTIANLLPRALDHHRWYIKRFPEYPKERKAVIPFIL